MYTIEDIRNKLTALLRNGEFVTDKSGVRTVELIGTSFKANKDHIFGEINADYIQRELDWYKSQSLQVADIPGKTPVIWEQVASNTGAINSNYGYLIWNFDNYHQYANALEELKANPNSRRAIMIYTRPSMQYDYKKNGMSDFICTNAVNYSIRKGKLNAVVQMRSNDAVYGYRNDYAFQKYVLDMLTVDLNVESGDIFWNAASLHVYERHFHMIEHYWSTGETGITKKEFDETYIKPKFF